MTTRLLVVICISIVVASCSSEPSSVTDVGVATGLRVEVVVDDLDGPTQFVIPNDERLFVAVINGGEDEQQGQVLRIDIESGDRHVVAEGLDKPTGLAVLGFDVWIMERNQLSLLNVGGGRLAKPFPRPIVTNLPNNGRSEGTLTRAPDNHLLFNTSGSKRGADVVEGSGRLYLLDAWNILDLDPSEWQDAPVELASGFKHAYAHVYDGDVLWTTEMSDGRFDGEPAADEVVRVAANVDHGWPHCVGDNRVVEEFGGTTSRCADTPPSLATFAPGATPTSIAVSPFDDNTLLVALWNEGRVVAIDTTSNDPSSYTDVVTGLIGPQHLVATADAVYISEFGVGRILRLSAK